MASKKNIKSLKKRDNDAYIAGAGIVIEQPITQTLEKNYMPYAMSVIVSRALPEIDGFKPSHRKLLYTMYKMGLLNGSKTKSANIVGQTMRLNPHGEQAIYETMVRLSKGHEALLHPYVESKGNFGKSYSRDMAYAASRYTEAKLSEVCNEFFRDIDKDTVDFIPNYDNSTFEPTLLPTTFPSILVNSNVGIAVSMASCICPFHLEEVCETAIALINNPEHEISDTINGPDFIGGGLLIYDKLELQKAIDTGRASFKIRGKYRYDKDLNCIEILQIPPTTTIEAIIDKIVELVKVSKVREIVDIRDETDLNGLKITIDLKRGTDPERLMQRLYKLTPLQDNFSCNFNILINGYPKVIGIKEILNHWLDFRNSCIKRRVLFELQKKQDKLHLLKGLDRILADIDKAIKIIRETAEEKEVVPNLMIGFGIDEIQSEYIAEIKLRHLNKEYILKRLEEIISLSDSINNMKETLDSQDKINQVIIDELRDVIKRYKQPRKTTFIYTDEINEEDIIDEVPDYPVNLFMTRDGYFKKVTPQSLRMSNEQKLKEGDELIAHIETLNNAHILFFTDKQQVYKSVVADFDDTKISLLGDYIPSKLSFDSDEKLLEMIVTKDYNESIIFCFDNGKIAKVPLMSYQTKTKRKKLANAYSNKSNVIYIKLVENDKDILFTASNGKKMLINTSLISSKATRDTQGIQVMILRNNAIIEKAEIFQEGLISNAHRYRPKKIPSLGFLSETLLDKNQLKL